VWTETDPDRCGLLPFVFEDGEFFRRYCEWALDVPMFFVHREGYIPGRSLTFRSFMEHGFEGHRATMDDWGLHLSTLFPESRIKQFMEVRGCDASSIEMIVALGALAAGFLYDDVAMADAEKLTASLSFAQRVEFAEAVAREGLKAKVPGQASRALDLARELLAIAKDGLSRRDPSEIPALAPLEEIAATGRTQADAMLDLWDRHKGAPEPIIEALRYRP
jgi:glutamate--cysteine ligase